MPSPVQSESKSDREYLVTSFQAMKSGALFALVLRVTVAKPIEWVRQNADQIAAKGVADDPQARRLNAPIVALNVEAAQVSA